MRLAGWLNRGSTAWRTAGSKVEGRRSQRLPYVLYGIVWLSVLVAISLSAYRSRARFKASYDEARYNQISKVIAADPQHFRGRRLVDVTTELGLEDVPWDDTGAGFSPGSNRYYHFRGFRLMLTLDENREGVTPNMLMGIGTAEEKLRGRELLRIDPHFPPQAVYDGISSREERMRRYWEEAEKEAREINKRMGRNHK